jgi:lipid A oxidase
MAGYMTTSALSTLLTSNRKLGLPITSVFLLPLSEIYMSQLRAALLSTVALTALAAIPAHAEIELQAFGGANWNFDSKIKTEHGAVNDSRTVGWEGKPDEAPPYWGVRATYWPESWNNWGIAFDYAHTKAYADINFATDPVFNHLEFTDGNNLYMIDALKRFHVDGTRLVPYVGVGAGVAIPHTEVNLDAYPNWRTFKYEYGGPAAQIIGGSKYMLTQHWGAFAEGKLSYSYIDGGLTDGGRVKTQLWSPQAAVGISYSF